MKEVAEPTPATKTNIGTGHDERKWENKRIEAYSPPNVYLIPSAHSVAGPDTPASNPLDNNEKERDRDLEFKVAAAREKVREARRMLMPPRSAAVDKSKEGNRDEIPKKRWADVDKDFEGFFKEKMKDNDGGLQKAMDDEQQHEEWAKRFKLWE